MQLCVITDCSLFHWCCFIIRKNSNGKGVGIDKKLGTRNNTQGGVRYFIKT